MFVVFRHRLRGRASGVDVETTGAAVFDMRDSLCTRMRAYLDVDEARAAAGLES